MAKDPVCGMVVDEKTALSSEIGSRTFYFCSTNCLNTFVNPEKELSKLKKRMYVAASGALVLAILRAAVYLGLAFGAVTVTWAPIPDIPFLTWGLLLFIIVTPIQFIGGWTFYVGAYEAVKRKTANMDLLISIGTLAAYIYSTVVLFAPDALPVKERDVYFEVSAVIIAFVLLGKYMEEAIKKRSSASVRKLLDLRPAMARVVRGGEEKEIPASEVAVDDILVVKPGEKIPTDGVIIDGSSAVDEKMITGESIPADKKLGDQVIGATVNKQGLLKVRATKVGKETALAQIVHIVEEAQASTGKIQRLVDSVSAKFVPAVVGVSIASFVIWYFVMGNFVMGLLSFIAVLIIACPCALGIATPAALMVGVGKGAEAGILIRGAEYLERSQKITAVVFDKTGTLTKGEPSVTDIVTVSGNKEELLSVAGSAEMGSEHPLAQAILKEAKKQEIKLQPPKDFEAVSGMGVTAHLDGKRILFGNRKLMHKFGIDAGRIEQSMEKLESDGKTVMIVARENEILGLIAVADTIKQSSPAAVKALRELKVETIMLTGDNEKTAKAVARNVGIDSVIANVLPAEKAAVIKRLQSEGKVVAMVGDGINDAPALAQADIGIAIGSGSDIAKETGGIILIKDDVMDVARSIRLARATMKKIRQNLFWALIYNTAGIPVAAIGLLSPIIAAAAMALSSISVIANSSLLKRLKIIEKEQTRPTAGTVQSLKEMGVEA
ncbi:heavy metal translocating P-type ATPase [Nitrososphaera sp.]|uniref:heavy metal translocating P-type ATPase n=1 Tax=Nitrososphaera sp. TaxID=1971748 RepID=UPI00184295DA|nr:heavy metal translocating P-type ATPase [Nitrososphaera sp.]NWG38201.1 heavy metal translocating P-type ATPase [Nitrososphaera sp.]